MKRILAPLAGVLALALLAGCSLGLIPKAGAALEAVNKMPVITGSTAATRMPMLEPESESELAAKSNYGYLILKTGAGFDASLIERLGAEVVDSFELDGARYSLVHKDSDVLGLLRTLKLATGVVYAEPDLKLELDAPVDYTAPLNDPWIRMGQYSYYITRLGEALEEFGVGTNEVYVAVVDSGINAPHEEFQGVWDHGYSMWSKAGTDGAVTYTYVGAGVEPVAMDGTNFDSNPAEGHGTHVAGTIAALGNNALGVTGVAPDNVKLITYKCFADDASGNSITGSGSSWSVYGSLMHLVDWKIANSVTQTIPVNMSLGGDYANYFAMDMIAYGLSENVVVVAASGNDGQELMQFPAGYSGVITVGATNGVDELVPFSNRGRHVSVTAPGYNIQSVGNWATSAYQNMSGTSMATPFVTGLVGLMLTFDPTLTPAEIKYLLEDNAVDLGAAGFDRSFGHGRVDVRETIAAVVAGGAIATPYASEPLVVELTNVDATFDSGNPDAVSAIIGRPVYLYDEAGAFVTAALTDDYGDAFFQFLESGTYTVATDYYGRTLSDASASRIDVTFTGANQLVSMEFSVPMTSFQTLQNDGNGYYNGGGLSYADTILHLFDGDLNWLMSYDWDTLDSIVWPCESGQSYYLAIEPYTDSSSTCYGGNYTLLVTQTPVADDLGNAGAALAGDPLVDGLESNDSPATATTVTIDTPLRAFLSDGLTFSDEATTIEAPTGADMIDWYVYTAP